MNFKQFILPSRNKNEVLSLEKSGKIGHGLDIHFVEKITQALDFYNVSFFLARVV